MIDAHYFSVFQSLTSLKNIDQFIIIQAKFMPNPTFEWYKDKAEKFRWRLKAANGEVVATSEGYSSKDACMKGIESVKKNAPIATMAEAKEKA